MCVFQGRIYPFSDRTMDNSLKALVEYVNVHDFVHVHSSERPHKADYIGNIHRSIIPIISIIDGIVRGKLPAGVVPISFTFTATLRPDTFLCVLMRPERVLFKRSKILPLI